MKKKIYCKNCKYYKDETSDWYGSNSYCKKIIGYKDTPIERESIELDIEEANEHNDCKYYEQPWYR